MPDTFTIEFHNTDPDVSAPAQAEKDFGKDIAEQARIFYGFDESVQVIVKRDGIIIVGAPQEGP